jgi:hypothetical protein
MMHHLVMQAGHMAYVQSFFMCTSTLNGKRGPLTQQLQQLYTAMVEADVAGGREGAWEDQWQVFFWRQEQQQ